MSAGAVRAGGVFVEIGADPRKFFSAFSKVNKQLGQLGGSMARAGTAVSAAGSAIVGPIFASAAAFASVGSALNDMSKRTGVAAESLSVLKFAAEQTGTDMAGVETAVKKMQKAIFAAGNGSKEAADALAMVGLSAKDLAGLSADEQMGKIADGLMAIQDPGARAAVAMQIFGKAGTSILPMLEGGSRGMAAFADEAKRLGLVMDSETAAKADALGDAMDALSAAMKMAFIQIGGAVAPILTKMANGLAIAAASAGKFISENQELVTKLLAVGSAMVAGGTGLFALGKALQITSSALGVFGKAASLVMSPITILVGAASTVGKSFTLAMPATIKLASTIGSSMMAASASVVSFAATAGKAMAGFAASSAIAVAGLAASSAAGFVRMSGAAATAAQSMFPVFFTGFNRGISAAAGFFSATLRGLNGVVMASNSLRGVMFSVAGSGMGRFVKDIVGGLTLTYKSFVWWATGASARMAQYAANVYMSAAATVANSARMGAAWVASALPGLSAFATAASGVLAKYVGSTVMAAVASASNAIKSGAAWVASALPGVLKFASGATAGIASYLGKIAIVAATSVSSAAAVAAAWVGSAARGVAAFVGSALAGIGSYIAGIVAAAAASVSAGAAMLAAWLAPLAPILAIAVAIAGVAALVSNFGGVTKSAFGALSGLVGNAAGAISETLSPAISDGIVVFEDLAVTARTTFDAVYEAVAAGDLSGAMDVLWKGLIAGWLRGSEALMSYVDPWVAAFQDVFTDIGSAIFMAWDKIYTDSAALLNTMGAFIFGIFDNIANGVMATFDNLVGAIQIAWTRVQGFITGAKDTEERVQAIKDKNAARAEQRRQERPGIEGRTAVAEKQNTKAEKDRQDRVVAVQQNAEKEKADRQKENKRLAEERRAATQAAEADLNRTANGQRETRVKNSQAENLLSEIKNATSTSQLAGEGGLGDQFQTLRDLGRLSTEQEKRIADALDKVAEDLTRTAIDGANEASKGANGAALDSKVSKSEVVGTFSSSNLSGLLGFSTGSLAERTAKASEETAKGVKELVAQGGGKVAA